MPCVLLVVIGSTAGMVVGGGLMLLGVRWQARRYGRHHGGGFPLRHR